MSVTQTLSSSCDVLFPEPSVVETIAESTHSTYCVGEAIYAAPSTNSAYSTYSQEIRTILNGNSDQIRQNCGKEHMNESHMNRPDLVPTPSTPTRTSGSAVVVTGYVKDENYNHHQVKFLDVSNTAYSPRDLNRVPHRSQSDDDSTVDRLRYTHRPQNIEGLSHKQAWHHRSLDQLASLDGGGSKENDHGHSDTKYMKVNSADNTKLTNHPPDGNLAHKPPVGHRLQSVHGPPYPGGPDSPRKLHWSLSAARRHTWSPPMFHKELSGGGTTLASMRSYHSNDQLDVEENCYEDLDAVTGPPQLASMSGKLDHKNIEKNVIRPVAFKPIVVSRQARYVRAPARSMLSPRQQRVHDLATTSTFVTHSSDDGYVSQDYNTGSHSHSTSNTSSVSHAAAGQSSSHDSVGTRPHTHTSPAVDPSMIYSPPNRDRKHIPLPERPDNQSSNQRASKFGYIQTPSPSDSGVCDVETMLRDKDAEIQALRETMANNEAVIFQVYEEKRQNYAMELKEIHDEWTRRFREHTQKAFKTEQALLLQLFKLQQERKTLKLDCETAKTEKEAISNQLEDLQSDQEKLNNKMEELQWEMVQKKGEIAHLKSQLKQSSTEQTSRNNDLFGLKSQLKDAAKDADDKDAQMLRVKTELEMTVKDNSSLRSEVTVLREQLNLARSDVERLKEGEFGYARPQEQLSSAPAAKSPPVSPLPTGVVLPARATASPSGSGQMAALPRTPASPSNASRKEIEELKVQLSKLKTEMEATCAQFEYERAQWLEEKNKVIRYQKHLQLNYVQMYRKNKMLETEVEQLMVELENRDLKLSCENGPIEGESSC